MSTRGVHNGTPFTGDWLCRTCSFAHIQKGYAASEEVVHCTYRSWSGRPQPVAFKIRECSAYADKRLPSLDGMEKSAWILVTKKAGRSAGFITAREFKKIEGEDAEIVP